MIQVNKPWMKIKDRFIYRKEMIKMNKPLSSGFSEEDEYKSTPMVKYLDLYS